MDDKTPSWMSSWQQAYPYLGASPTSAHQPTLGDYSDSRRKFMDMWAVANPYNGLNPTSFGMSQAEMEAAGNATDESRRAFGDYEQWGSQGEQAWRVALTPEQRAQYDELKAADYAKKQRMGQMAFLAAAGAMAAPGLIGAMGAEGAGAGGAAAAGGDLGMAGWIPETAGAWSEAGMGLQGGLGSFIPGVDSAASGYGFASEVPSWASGASGAGWTGGVGAGAGTLGSSTWNNIPEFLKSLGTSAAKNVGGNWLSQLITSGTNAYMGNKQAGQYQDVINQINQLYAPDSPYAKQMQQAMERKDAAAGRNSQYGTRAVELAAALTNSKANALTSEGYQNLLKQRGINQNMPWNGFLAALGSDPGQDLITKAGGNVGSWLGGLFGNGGDKITPTTPNSGNNWWDNWGGYIGGGP